MRPQHGSRHLDDSRTSKQPYLTENFPSHPEEASPQSLGYSVPSHRELYLCVAHSQEKIMQLNKDLETKEKSGVRLSEEFVGNTRRRLLFVLRQESH